MKKYLGLCLAGFVLVLLLAACAGPQQQPNYNLFGTWREAQSNTVFEFRQDGVMRLPQQSGIIEVKYEFSGQDTILISPTPDTAADQRVEWKYTIAGDTLTLKVTSQDATTGQAAQQSITLTRVK